MPVFAIDIDGTIAVNGQWFARWMAREFDLPISEEQLAAIQYGPMFWELPQVRALTSEQRQAMRGLARSHQHDIEHHRHAVPIPFAAEALHHLRQYGDILYTTCRQEDSREVTQAWLEEYGFPNPDSVAICKHYHWKLIHAHEKAGKKNPVVMIDDQVEDLVKAFSYLARRERERAISMVRYLALIAIGQEEPPQFPFKVPFPVLALRSWRKEDLEELNVPGPQHLLQATWETTSSR